MANMDMQVYRKVRNRKIDRERERERERERVSCAGDIDGGVSPYAVSF
jgi:hypothetical protein